MTLFPMDDITLQCAKARTDDPPTSHEAAAKVEASGSAESHRRAVMAAIRWYPGLTSAEIAVKTYLDRHEAARRCSDLERAGIVRKGDKRACTTNGNTMMTWWPVVKSPPDQADAPHAE